MALDAGGRKISLKLKLNFLQTQAPYEQEYLHSNDDVATDRYQDSVFERCTLLYQAVHIASIPAAVGPANCVTIRLFTIKVVCFVREVFPYRIIHAMSYFQHLEPVPMDMNRVVVAINDTG